jgi:hypothetical protein
LIGIKLTNIYYDSKTLLFRQGKGDVSEVYVSFLDNKRSSAWVSPAAVQPWSAPTAALPRPHGLSPGRAKQLAAAEAEAASLFQARLTS